MSKDKIKKPANRIREPKVIRREKVAFRTNYYAGIVIAVVTFFVYMNTLKLNYALDDSAAITDNKFVQEGSHGIPKLMTVDFWYFSGRSLGYYRPLSLITFAIEYQLFGLSCHVSHLNNILLFALAASSAVPFIEQVVFRL